MLRIPYFSVNNQGALDSLQIPEGDGNRSYRISASHFAQAENQGFT